jgi:hypothetical protein
MSHESVREMADVESRYSAIPASASWLHSFILSMLDQPMLSTTKEAGQTSSALDSETSKLTLAAPEIFVILGYVSRVAKTGGLPLGQIGKLGTFSWER